MDREVEIASERKIAFIFISDPFFFLFLLSFSRFWKTETELVLEINMFRRLPPIVNFYRFEIRSFTF